MRRIGVIGNVHREDPVGRKEGAQGPGGKGKNVKQGGGKRNEVRGVASALTITSSGGRSSKKKKKVKMQTVPVRQTFPPTIRNITGREIVVGM